MSCRVKKRRWVDRDAVPHSKPATNGDPDDRGEEPDVRHGHGQDRVLGRKFAQIAHDGPWIDEVLEDVCADDQVERTLQHPKSRLDGLADDPIQDGGGAIRARRIDLDAHDLTRSVLPIPDAVGPVPHPMSRTRL